MLHGISASYKGAQYDSVYCWLKYLWNSQLVFFPRTRNLRIEIFLLNQDFRRHFLELLAIWWAHFSASRLMYIAIKQSQVVGLYMLPILTRSVATLEDSINHITTCPCLLSGFSALLIDGREYISFGAGNDAFSFAQAERGCKDRGFSLIKSLPNRIKNSLAEVARNSCRTLNVWLDQCHGETCTYYKFAWHGPVPVTGPLQNLKASNASFFQTTCVKGKISTTVCLPYWETPVSRMTQCLLKYVNLI